MTEFAFRPREWWQKLVAPIDPALLAMLALLIGYALLVLTSASPERLGNQAINLAAALVAMRLAAQVPPQRLMHLAVPLYVAGVLLLVAVALRDFRRTIRVLAPLVGAVALVMAAHLALGVRMTLLHLVGLLLIVAVGSNYALFFNQRVSQTSGAALPRTTALASLALANVSTIIGFGVLALSNVPVLNAIGATVGPGALLALLLAMSWAAGDARAASPPGAEAA